MDTTASSFTARKNAKRAAEKMVRYPIPERIFDYVSTVRSATAGTCQNETSRFLGKGALGQLLIIGALSRSSKGK